MTIRSVQPDAEQLTLTVVADFPVPVYRLWDGYCDPRQLEAFWGPPTWPATFTQHQLFAGGTSYYHMTGPNGERASGYWEVRHVAAPHEFTIVDGFSHADGTPNPDLPTTRTTFRFEESTLGSMLTTITLFDSRHDFDQLLEMQMIEGTRDAMEQIDEVVTDESTYSARHIAQLEYITDTVVRVSRVIRAPIDKIWDAHRSAELLRQWMVGPDGWDMTTCETAQTVGAAYRYEWQAPDSDERFGLTGQLVASSPPHSFTTTESVVGGEGPEITNVMTLIELSQGTLLTLVMTYPSSQPHGLVTDTDMVTSMENSYSRLESLLVTT